MQAEADRLEGRARADYAEPWQVQNALAIDRYVLASQRFATDLEVPGSIELELLWRRQRVADEEIGPTPRPAASDGLALLLWTELELDRIVLGRAPSDELARTLDELALATPDDTELAQLTRQACQRARAYGLLPIVAGFNGRAWTLAARDGRGLGAELGRIVERRGGRLAARDWRAALFAALTQRGLAAHDVARAWAPE